MYYYMGVLFAQLTAERNRTKPKTMNRQPILIPQGIFAAVRVSPPPPTVKGASINISQRKISGNDDVILINPETLQQVIDALKAQIPSKGWKVQAFGHAGSKAWEISVVRKSNEHGQQSYGWFSDEKHFISGSGPDNDRPILQFVWDEQMEVARKLCANLNKAIPQEPPVHVVNDLWDDVPESIHKAAHLIEEWMIQNGHDNWAIGGVMKRQ